MKYLIVIEQTSSGYSAYSPDLPGCVATAGTKDEVQREMKDAIAFHLDGLREEGFLNHARLLRTLRSLPSRRSEFHSAGASGTAQAFPPFRRASRA
jgi:predicted RNase H-like HicB family nuclease